MDISKLNFFSFLLLFMFDLKITLIQKSYKGFFFNAINVWEYYSNSADGRDANWEVSNGFGAWVFWAQFVCLPKIKFLLNCRKVGQRPEGYIQTKEIESFKGQK